MIRLEQLTFTRFLAAISIVIFHYGSKIFPFNTEVVSSIFKQANVGVSYFFLLSGFVMIVAYGKKEKVSFWNFITRRLARIFPVYVLAILLLLANFLWVNKSIDLKAFFLNLSLFQCWFPGYALSFNSPGWSLSIELFFYISFPFLLNYVYVKYPFWKLIFPIGLLYVLSQIALHVMRYSSFYQGDETQSHDLIFYFPLMHWSEFLIGNLAGLFFLKGIRIRNYDLAIVALLSILTILLYANFEINFHNGLLAIVFVPLILFISANNGMLTKLSSNQLAVYLGEISYGVYILQKPIYAWVNWALKSWNIHDLTISFYVSLLVLLCFSAVSYRYFEIPIRKYITNRV